MPTPILAPDPADAAATRADERLRCTECGSGALHRDDQRGELVCQACGLVLQERMIDPGPEWRSFDAEQRNSRARTGAPATFLLHDKGLTTDIGWPGRDVHGKRVPSANRALMFRLRRWQRRLRLSGAGERSLAHALAELDRVAARVGLTRNVREAAAMIHRRAMARNLVLGRTIEAVAAASLYAACRQAGLPRTLDEIAEAARVPRPRVGRAYRVMARELRLGIAPQSPLDYVGRFASDLGVGRPTEALAEAILRQAVERGLANGKGPTGMAGAALYIAGILAGEARGQREVAAAAGVTEVTIRTRYRELASKLDLGALAPGAAARLAEARKHPPAARGPHPPAHRQGPAEAAEPAHA